MNRLLESAPHWLLSQPGLSPWSEGRVRIANQIDRWVEQYWWVVCDQEPSVDGSFGRQCAQRLWDCWEYHWRQAIELAGEPVDGFSLAGYLENGLGFQGGGRLGGNPLEDVVLATAVLCQEPAAIDRFSERYQAGAIRVATKVNPRVREDEQDWWCQLLVHLMGVGDRPGKLQKYSGHCGLSNWLARVAKNFSVRWGTASTSESDLLEEVVVQSRNDAEVSECQKLLGGAVRDAVGRLSPEQGTLLYFLFDERLPGKEISAILGVHPGSVSRKKDKAIDLLQEALAAIDGPPNRAQAYRDCLESLTGTRNWRELADVFLGALQEYRPDGDGQIDREEEGA